MIELKEELKEIIESINKLYILGRNKYLSMDLKGEYCTIKYNKGEKKKGNRPLVDTIIQEHLQGKRTIGVFSSMYSKFICFDVDIKKPDFAKWVVYKLIDTLQNFGINEKYIYVSTSGNKGYHVEIFFTKPVQNTILKEFYLLILNNAELLNADYGQVELRPTDSQGVKLPLGIHQKTKKRCWYCNWTKKLKPIEDYKYILCIKQLDTEFFYNYFNKANDKGITEIQAQEIENIIQRHKQLPIYKQNIDEDITVESIERLINDGLTMQGTRHNSLMKIAKYNKHNGMMAEDNKEFLIKWMEGQDKRTYSTKWEDVLKDIGLIILYTYEKNYQLIMKNNDISVNTDELMDILKVKNKNHKLLLYALLVHSKRYCNNDGIFYMSYKQMQEVTGLTDKTVRTIIKYLEENKLIDVFRGNKIYNKNTKKPISETNRYKYNLLSVKTYNLENKNIFKVCDKNCTGCFNACICNLIENKQLKDLLSRRQFEEVKKFTNYCSMIS